MNEVEIAVEVYCEMDNGDEVSQQYYVLREVEYTREDVIISAKIYLSNDNNMTNGEYDRIKVYSYDGEVVK
jgi:hypothetical protein